MIGLTKISKMFEFSAPFGKFSSILRRMANSAQGGRFYAKFCVHRILTSLITSITYLVTECNGRLTRKPTYITTVVFLSASLYVSKRVAY